jgi:hypothetical protein
VWMRRCLLVMLLSMDICSCGDLRNVSHSGGQDDSLDSTRQFHLPVSGRFVSSWPPPSRSKPVKCLVERPHFQSSGGRRHKNQGYFFVPSKPKHLHNSMPFRIDSTLMVDGRTRFSVAFERWISWRQFVNGNQISVSDAANQIKSIVYTVLVFSIV